MTEKRVRIGVTYKDEGHPYRREGNSRYNTRRTTGSLRVITPDHVLFTYYFCFHKAVV